jgi:putative endonuclease
MTCYTYILECEDGSYYTGWTNDLEKRYKAHCSGKGAKYTRSHKPVRIAYYEESEDKITAEKREYEIKHLTRRQKENLISGKNT